MILVT